MSPIKTLFLALLMCCCLIVKAQQQDGDHLHYDFSYDKNPESKVAVHFST